VLALAHLGVWQPCQQLLLAPHEVGVGVGEGAGVGVGVGEEGVHHSSASHPHSPGPLPAHNLGLRGSLCSLQMAAQLGPARCGCMSRLL
jgi:hypothetical protein